MTLDEAISEYNAVAAEAAALLAGDDVQWADDDYLAATVVWQLVSLCTAAFKCCQQQDSRLKGVEMALYASLDDEPPTVDHGATEALKDA